MGGRMRLNRPQSFARSVVQLLGGLAMYAVTFVAAAIVAFVPLTALPGELQTNFVNAGWLKFAYLVAGVAALSALSSTMLSQGGSWRGTLRSCLILLAGFVGFFWLFGGLIWLNAYSVQGGRERDTVIVCCETGANENNHYRIAEIGSSWQADLESTHERDAFTYKGACIRVTVRQGRLGLDWISDARPIECPRPPV